MLFFGFGLEVDFTRFPFFGDLYDEVSDLLDWNRKHVIKTIPSGSS